MSRQLALHFRAFPVLGKRQQFAKSYKNVAPKAANKKVPKFNHIEMNGLRLQTPQHAYSLIAEELTGRRFSPA